MSEQIDRYEWVEFKRGNPLPPEKRWVLVQCAEQPERGLPPCVVVGYLRYPAGDKDSPLFTMPGVGLLKTVTHWSDCLGDNFKAPLWPGTHSAAPRTQEEE